VLFQATGPAGPADDLAQVLQSIDATDLRGNRLCIGAMVKRVAGDAETDTRFRLGAWTWLGGPEELADRWETLQDADCTVSGGCVIVEASVSPEAWTPLVGELFVPATPGTAALVAQIGAHEDVADDLEAPELDGHQVDAVWLYAP
jgi:hypothetical protein